jgi:hypothetical protein
MGLVNQPNLGFSSVGFLWMVLLISFVLLVEHGVVGLDQQEIGALTSLYDAWHPTGWNTSFSLACDFPAIQCDSNTHIVQLGYVTCRTNYLEIGSSSAIKPVKVF